MSSAHVGVVLRHIRKLAAVRKDHELPDHELLERFAQQRDEAAFDALLRRHGPMVLGVCRSVLRDVHDAEDAFQAAFLVLAQKAGSIHRRESVGGWLYRVAYHLAVRAQANAARRRVLEKRTVTMPSADPVLDMSLREVRAVLLEELEGLSEQYRAPLVLCGLEEKTLEEAARLLGWTRYAVKGRLQRGRELLRARLRRRGLELPAALSATALALNSASAQVSTTLADSTLRAALKVAAGKGTVAAVASAEVAALVQGVNKTMFHGKAKTVILLLLALGMGATGLAAARPDDPGAPPATTNKTAAAPPQARGEPPAAAPASDQTDEALAVSGRVLDPDGKPFAGAKLYLASYKGTGYQTAERAVSDKDGQFRFTMPRAEFDRSRALNYWEHSRLLAVAKGYGPDLVTFDKGVANSGLTLRLVKDLPLTGRIFDADGKPVAGAHVRVTSLSAFANESVTGLLEDVRTGSYAGDVKHGGDPGICGGDKFWIGPLPGQAEEITTDADGRFRLTGLGRERHVRLRVDGPGIQHGYVVAVTRPMIPLVGPRISAGTLRLYGATFDHVAVTARPLRGVVRAKATGKPVSGVLVSGRDSTFTTRTDREGRFELLGCPKAPTYEVTATPADGQPYFAKTVEVADNPGFAPLTADLDLAAGIPLTGHVLDGATKKPVAGATVAYYPMMPNPFAVELSYNPVVGPSTGKTAADGSFRLAVLPGPGVVAVTCLSGHPYMPALYTTKEIQDFFKGKGIHQGTNDEFILVQQGANGMSVIGQKHYQALLLLDPAEKTTALAKDLTVQPGRAFKGTVVGPDGKPLPGVKLNGEVLVDGTFTLSNLNPRRSSGLYFVHPEKGLGLFKELPPESDKPLTVQLQPCGSVTGRLLDRDRQPLADVVVRIGHVQVKTGKDGRFRADGLVVGQKYHAEGVDRVRQPPFYEAIRIEPGKVKDLGDAVVKNVGE